jgi:hypothetical protein
MRTDGSSNATWNPSIFGGFLWAALTVVTVLPLAPAGAQEAAPFFISQLDPKKAAPGEVVVLRFKSPLPSPVSTVTFDDLKADILGSSDYAVRVSVPSGLVANSTPVVVVRTGSRASEPYQDFTVAGLPAPAASPTSAPAAKKTEWESWLVPIIIIIGGMAVLVGYSYTFWQRTRELRRQSAERAKALESFRTQLQAARTPPSTTPTEGPPAVPDSLVSACAAGECVLLAGSGTRHFNDGGIVHAAGGGRPEPRPTGIMAIAADGPGAGRDRTAEGVATRNPWPGGGPRSNCGSHRRIPRQTQ